MNRREKFILGGFLALISILLLPLAVSAAGGKVVVKPEIMEINWMGRFMDENNTSWFVGEVEKEFNVRIIPNGIAAWDDEKVEIMLATGALPDAGYVWKPLQEMYDGGLIRGIPTDMIRKYMPNYCSLLDDSHPIGWLIGKNKHNPKEYLTIHGIAEGHSVNYSIICFRNDWVKNVGFELPNYEEKKMPLDDAGRVYFLDEDFTLEWFERLLIAFRDKDPDGNGKNDTIPYGANNANNNNVKSTTNFNIILGAHGLSFRNAQIDGKFYTYNIAPPFKDFLNLLAKWYKDRLIDQEFPTIGREKMWEKVSAGLIASCETETSYAGSPTPGKIPPDNLVKDDEVGTGPEVVCIPPLIGPKGHQGGTRYSASGSAVMYNNFWINSKVDDNKLKKILEILDLINYNGIEWWFHKMNGKPGVHFDWQGEPWNSAIVKRKPEDIPDGYSKAGGWCTVYPPCSLKERRFYNPKAMVNFKAKYSEAERGQSHCMDAYRLDFFNETELSKLEKKYGATLNTITNEFIFKGITGVIDINAEWESYVANWKKNGGDEILAEYEKAPLVSGLLQGKRIY